MATAARTDDDLAERLQQAVRRHVDAGHVGAASWRVQRGDVVADGSAGRFHDGTAAQLDSIYRITSMSKPIAAVAALTFVADDRADLDEPVGLHLPELAELRVLRSPDAEVHDTVPADRPVALRDLMAFTLGWGMDFFGDGPTPWDRAAENLGVAFGGPDPNGWPPPDEWIAAMGTLPLRFQPGTGWSYHLGSDVLGVWLQRIGGGSLADVLARTVLDPLGMVDTGFWVPEGSLDRFGACTRLDHDSDEVVVHDEVRGDWSAPPSFPSAGAGLVSTVADYTAFARMLLRGGISDAGVEVLPAELVAEMSRDQLTEVEGAHAELLDGTGWGLGVAVNLADTPMGPAGSIWWDGGFGSIWTSDPGTGTSLVLLTDRMWSSPDLQAYAVDVRREVFG